MSDKKPSFDLEMIKKTIKLWFWSILRLGRWYLPGVPEIKADKLLEKIQTGEDIYLIDVREESDINKQGYIEHSQRFSYFDFTNHVDQIPKTPGKLIVTICPGGGASLVVAEMLLSKGYVNVKSLKGGMKNWSKKGFPILTAKKNLYTGSDSQSFAEKSPFLQYKPVNNINELKPSLTVEARNLACPGPLLDARRAIKKIKIGQILEILTTDERSLRDIPAWVKITKQEFILYQKVDPNVFHFFVRKLV